ncbi:MAG: hypothetical protein J0M13_07050 [Candidatus Accumulibacter sp.]|jgi:hypothetical protein|nr:hypothetical protein [Candidatus Accumulibacter necessarius]
MPTEAIEFRVNDDTLRGDLFRPEVVIEPPLLVMAHRFGAEQLPEIAAMVAQVPLALASPACCFTRRYSPVRSGCRRATLA